MESLIRRYRVDQSKVEGPLFSTQPDKSGLFKVQWNRVVHFWKDYCLLSSANGVKSSLYEYNPGEATLKIIFNFSFPKGITLEVINEKFLSRAIAVIQDSLTRIFSLKDNDYILKCHISKTKIYNNKCSVNFTFPAFRLSQNIFNDKVLPEIKNQFRIYKLLSTLPIEPINSDWNSIIVPMDNFFMVHGSIFESYKFLDSVIDISDDTETIPDGDIYDAFDHESHSWFLTRSTENVFEDEKTDFTPIILSSFYSDTFIHYHDDSAEDKKTRNGTDISSSESVDMISYLIPLISKKRLIQDVYWTEVGRAIFNIFRCNLEEGYNCWISYDPLNEPRDIYNRDKWLSFHEDSGINDYLSIRTIAFYAAVDSPDEYKEWKTTWMEESVKKSMSLIEIDIAEVVYRYFWLDFLTVGSNHWYKFEQGSTRLTKMCGPIDFTRRLTEVMNLYLQLRMSFSREMHDLTDSKSKKETLKDTKNIDEVIKRLGTAAFQSNMIKLCFPKFHRENVEKFFDTNPSLLSWQNVVSHVHGVDIYVREGKMEDFITKSTYIYLDTKAYNWEHPLVKEILKWFRMMFPEDDSSEYFIKICSSLLYGKNSEKFFLVWSGVGDNSKSQVIKLLQRVLGDYAVDFPVELLTGNKAHSSGPSPELAQARGARVVFVSEPESDIPLRCGNIKRYTGGDRFFARNCNENGGSVDAMFKMIFTCNRIPQIDGADTAMMNRFRYLPFLSVFSDTAPESEKEQFEQRKFPKDHYFEDKLNDFRRPMAWIMLQYFSNYRKEGLKSPKIVEEYTRKHWEDNDPYQMFFKEYLIKGDPEDKINTTFVYAKFKQWYRGNFPTSIIPDQRAMTSHLSTSVLMGPQINRCWPGWKLRSFEAEKPVRKSSGIE